MNEIIVTDPADPNSGKMVIDRGVHHFDGYWPRDQYPMIQALLEDIEPPIHDPSTNVKYINWLIFHKKLRELFVFLTVEVLINDLTYVPVTQLYPGFINYLKITFGEPYWNNKAQTKFAKVLIKMKTVQPGPIFRIWFRSTDKPFQRAIRICLQRLDFDKLPTEFTNANPGLEDLLRNGEGEDNTYGAASDENITTATTPPPPPTTVVDPRTRSNEDRVDDDEDEDDDGTGSNHDDDTTDDSEDEDDDETGSNHDADAILYAELLAQSEAFLASDDTAADTTDDSIIAVYSDVDRRADEVLLLELQREIAALTVSSDDNEE